MEHEAPNVPLVVLYHDPRSDLYHCAPLGCKSNSYVPQHDQGVILGDLLEDAYKTKTATTLCWAPECKSVLNHVELTLVLHAYLDVRHLQDAMDKKDPLKRLTLFSAAHAGEQGGVRLMGTGSHPELRKYHQALRTQADRLVREHIKDMRTEAYREGLYQATRGRGKLPGSKERRLGLLVGPAVLRPSGYYLPDDVVLALLDQDPEPEDTVSIIGPVGVLTWGSDDPHLQEGETHLGRRRQVMELPPGLTEAHLETILGLYDPDGDGPMAQLPKAVEAARRVLGC